MINVIGLGFVGLTTALGFAHKGISVTGIDKNKNKIKSLKINKIDFFEPKLETILKNCNKKKKINFNTKLNINNKILNKVFICVGTPEKRNGDVNLSEIKNIIKNICSKYKNQKIIIVIKSTVPPGTISEKLNKIIKKNNNIELCSNPEFLREGYAWDDFINSDKIVIGSNKKKSQTEIKNIYKKFKGKKIITDTNTSEFIKYLSNSLLANLISFSNEMMMLGEKLKNIDILKSFHAVKLDKRWFGSPAKISDYFHPGIGFGGYCLPKDLAAISFLSKKKKIKSHLLHEIQRTNEIVFNYQIKKITSKIKKDSEIVILGLTFKPGSSDLRGSKSFLFVSELKKRGYRNLKIFDPSIVNSKDKSLKKIKILKKLKYKSNAVYILLTAWPKITKFLNLIKPKKLIDLRYVVN
jgi:UDPglucose 6-dehydrogenase